MNLPASPSTNLTSSSNNNTERSTRTSVSHQALDGSQRRSSSPFPKYVYDLSYNVRKRLCDLLDADESWRQLGGQFCGFDETQLTLISHALYRGDSPTNVLLKKWEQTNPKVETLFKSLARMKHVRALLILRSTVDPMLADPLIQKLQMESTSGDPFLSSSSLFNRTFDTMGAVGGYSADGFNQSRQDVKKSEKKVINTCRSGVWNDFNQTRDATVDGDSSRESGARGSSVLGSLASRQSEVEEDLEVLYKELLLATDDFCADNILGSGGFGVVYRGEWKGTQVAIKRLKGVNNVSQAITELKVLNRYRIDNIVPLYGISLDGPEACIVYQLMPNGSLEDRLLCKPLAGHKDPPVLTWFQRASIGSVVMFHVMPN